MESQQHRSATFATKRSIVGSLRIRKISAVFCLMRPSWIGVIFVVPIARIHFDPNFGD
ncbi:hypothetical protein CPB83DRAFT_844653 [Crepidotus variabilis]|uniref:Uncharacterized protein n=1 Tax=Crepidotus variabilis TaxID=179855 RepID=A0A9P6JUV8_9AGAR|nr:hypothetical protein CPB83DRAFT_844653 [Crepidotus variabilis]